MANIPGFPGYVGWGQAEAEADFRATGGRGKEGGGGGGSGPASSSGFSPISAADFASLETKAFEMLKPYYIEVAKQSRGNFDRAIAILDEDYKIGVRQVTEDYTKRTREQAEDYGSTIEQLGLQEATESESIADQLNKRGMAVSEMTPGTPGGYNVLNLGRGGVEVSRLKDQQALRREAVERANSRRVDELTTGFKRFTNPPSANATPGQIAETKDRTTLGSAELGLVRGREQATAQQQQVEQDLFRQRRQEAFGIASALGSIQAREIPSALTNRYLTSATQEFKNLGV